MNGAPDHTVSDGENFSILDDLIFRKSNTYQMFLGWFLFRNDVQHLSLYHNFRHNSLKSFLCLKFFVDKCQLGRAVFHGPFSHSRKLRTTFLEHNGACSQDSLLACLNSLFQIFNGLSNTIQHKSWKNSKTIRHDLSSFETILKISGSSSNSSDDI